MQQYSAKQVERHLREQQASGLSASEYCRRHRVNVWTFRGWRQRRQRQHQGQGAGIPFVRLEVPSPKVIEVVTGSRATVRIPLEADGEGLRQVLTALKRSRLVA